MSEQDKAEIDHKNVSEDHLLDYPTTSVKSKIQVYGSGGTQKLEASQASGGFITTVLNSQGSVKLEALVRGEADDEPIKREIRTSFRVPVEALPDLIDELEDAIDAIEENAEERGYEDGSLRCALARGEDDGE